MFLKKLSFHVSSFLLVSFFCGCNGGGVKDDKQAFHTLSGNRPLVIGHRGSPAYDGENTIHGFKRAVLDLRADGFEIDVVLSQDSQLVVCHDYELTRLTGKKQLEILFPEKAIVKGDRSYWFVSDFTKDELHTLMVIYPAEGSPSYLDYTQLNDDYRIPSFKEVLDLFVKVREEAGNPFLKLYVEIKVSHFQTSPSVYEKIMEQLIGSLEEKGLANDCEGIWIQSFDSKLMALLGQREEIKELKKTQLALGSIYEIDNIKTEEDLKSYLQEHVVSKNLQILHMSRLPFYYLVKNRKIDVVGVAHELGLELHLYTFRDRRFFTDYLPYEKSLGLTPFHSAQEELQFYYKAGVDAIMTDNVLSAREAMKGLD